MLNAWFKWKQTVPLYKGMLQPIYRTNFIYSACLQVSRAWNEINFYSHAKEEMVLKSKECGKNSFIERLLLTQLAPTAQFAHRPHPEQMERRATAASRGGREAHDCFCCCQSCWKCLWKQAHGIGEDADHTWCALLSTGQLNFQDCGPRHWRSSSETLRSSNRWQCVCLINANSSSQESKKKNSDLLSQLQQCSTETPVGGFKFIPI